MKRFFPYAAIGMVLGIAIEYYAYIDYLKLAYVLGFLIILVATIYIFTRDKGLIYISLFFIFGIILSRSSRGKRLDLPEEEFEILGRVESVEDRLEDRVYTFTLEGLNGRLLKKKRMLRLGHRGDRNLDMGDRALISCNLKEIEPKKNPHVFDFKKHLASKNIYTTAYISDYDILKIQENTSLKYSLRKYFRNYIGAIFNGLDKKNKNLITAIFLGDSSNILSHDLEKYRGLGLAHILAVSGLHIEILAGFMAFIFQKLSLDKNLSRLIIVTILCIYAYLIGFPISIVRSLIMLMTLYTSRFILTSYDRKNTIFFSMFIVALIWPQSILGLSFKLSFMALISLDYLTPKLLELFYPLDNSLIRGLSSVLAVQIGLGPILSYNFNSLNILGLISNILILPFLSLALKLSFLLIIAPRILSPLLPFINIILNTAHRLMTVIFKLDPIMNLNLKFTSLGLAYYYLIILILINIRQIRRLELDLIKSYCIINIISIFLLIIAYVNKPLEVHFIDVGQGDSILIKGRRNYLVDSGGEIGGSFKIGQAITLPYLLGENAKNIDYLFISHYHEDHCKGILDMESKLRIKKLILPHKGQGPLADKIIGLRQAKYILQQGQSLRPERKLTIKRIDPENSKAYNDENDRSQVLLVEYLNRRILLTGDISSRVEEEIRETLKDEGPLDILKVAHHGSNSSSSWEFIKDTRPKHAVFSLGRDNIYSHPNQEVVDRFERASSKIHRTDHQGRLVFKIGREDIDFDFYLDKKLEGRYLIWALSYLLILIGLGLKWEKDRLLPGQDILYNIDRVGRL